MKTLLTAVFVLSLFPPAVQAQSPAPNPRVDVFLYNTQVAVRGLDGSTQPLAISDASQRVHLRTYDDTHMVEQQAQQGLEDLADLTVRLGAGAGHLSADGLFGDLRATLSYSGPSPQWSTVDLIMGTNAQFLVPAHSILSIVGWINIDSAAPRDVNYAAFERGFISGTAGALGSRFILDGATASSQYTISAINPLDEAATFYYYSSLFAVAFSAAAAVPEPSTALMLGAGLLVLLHWRSRRAHGRR